MALFAAALLLCAHLPYAALDIVRHVRAKRHATSWDRLLGGALSWGTGLWAAALLMLLERHGGRELSHDAVLLMASWLLALGCAFGLIGATAVALTHWRSLAAIGMGLT